MDILPFTHNNPYFFLNISPDLFINTSIACIIIMYAYFSKIIKEIELFLFLISVLLVFLIPYIFPVKYLADQIPYTNFTRELKSGIVPETGLITLYSSYIYSFLPLPTPSSVTSFSMYNKII